MANLKDTEAEIVTASKIINNNDVSFDLENVKRTEKFDRFDNRFFHYEKSFLYTRKYIIQVDRTNRTSGASWVLGPTFNKIENIKKDSLIYLYYFVPYRNNSDSWGGAYTEPQVQFNDEGWYSLGSSGYNAVMSIDRHTSYPDANTINAFRTFLVLNPDREDDYDIQFRFYFRSYDGTLYWNGSRDIGLISNTAPLLYGTDQIQDYNYAHLKFKELARFSNG